MRAADAAATSVQQQGAATLAAVKSAAASAAASVALLPRTYIREILYRYYKQCMWQLWLCHFGYLGIRVQYIYFQKNFQAELVAHIISRCKDFRIRKLS